MPIHEFLVSTFMKIVKIFGLFHIWTKSKLMNRHSSQPFSAHYYTTSELITDNSYQFQSFADLNPSESAEDIKVQNKPHYGLPWSIVSKIIDKYPKWIYTVRACSRQAYRFCGVAIWPSYSPYNFNSQNYMNDPCIYYLWDRRIFGWDLATGNRSWQLASNGVN